MSLEIRHPGAIPALKAAYEASAASRRRVTASYEELLSLFCDLGHTGREISAQFQVAFQYMAFLHHTYFELVLGFTFAERDRFCQEYRREGISKPAGMSQFPRPFSKPIPVLGPPTFRRPSNLDDLRETVLQAAQAAGLTVQAALKQTPRRKIRSRNCFCIQGKICNLYFARSAYEHVKGSRSYYRFGIQVPQPWSFDAAIFIAADPLWPLRMFVVPRPVLEEAFKGVAQAAVYIPTRDDLPVYHNVRGRQWSPYENAWYILKDSPQVQTA